MKFFQNKKALLSSIILIAIIGIAAFFRLYKINEYMIFLGDEGRDVLVVKRMIVDHKLTLLGPITSVGSMYMGPVYYYMMVPALALSGLNPVGPAIMVALLSIATVFAVYYLGNRYFSKTVGLIASFFYAISPLAIIQGRSSWNPNVVPFFSTLMLLGLYKVIIEKKEKYMALIGVMLGILIQLHYTSVYLLITVVASILITKTKISLKAIGICFLGWLAAFSPFLLFEVRHEFTNIRAVLNFLTTGSETQGTDISRMVHIFQDVVVRMFWRLLVIVNAELTEILIIASVVVIGFVTYKKKEKINELLILLMWFLSGVLAFSLYGGIIYDYYFVGMFPIPFLVFGIFIDKIRLWKPVGICIAIALVVALTVFNLQKNPDWLEPNNLMNNTQTISNFINKKVDGKKYNFALLAGKNSDHAYKYFLEVWGNPPTTIENPVIDPDRKTVTNDLYIVCEEKECHPLGHPLWEIAGFGQAEIKDQWTVSTAKVFHLIPLKNKTEK